MTPARSLLGCLALCACAASGAAAQDIELGHYAGGTLGRADGPGGGDVGFDGDTVAGLFTGVRAPLGGGAFWGGEVEASRLRHDFGETTLEGSLRLKLQIGLREGRWSGWVVAGPAIGLAGGVAEPGWVAGAGAGFALTDEVRLGAELLRQGYPGAGEGAWATTFGLRLSVAF